MDYTFIQTMAAFLGMTTDRIKIVGIRNPNSQTRRLLEEDMNSTEVTCQIDDEEDIGQES